VFREENRFLIRRGGGGAQVAWKSSAYHILKKAPMRLSRLIPTGEARHKNKFLIFYLHLKELAFKL